jgi:carbon storage regulator CsrA
MLILSRKLSESVTINQDIVVTVKRIGRQVILAIDAPKYVPIVRSELIKKDHKLTGVQEILNRDARSHVFPDVEWLQSVGFSISETKHAVVATIVIEDFNNEFGQSRVELALSLLNNSQEEWTADLVSVDENGQTIAEIGLVRSWPKTRADVIRLGMAMNIKSWQA